MSSTQARLSGGAKRPRFEAAHVTLEVVVIPSSSVARAKSFYKALGWRLDVDFADSDGVRIVQFDPTGSECAVRLSAEGAPSSPGSSRHLYLAVIDIDATRSELLACGHDVGEVLHDRWLGDRFCTEGRVTGHEPDWYAAYTLAELVRASVPA
jgi:predicted enzyme related to lactoylglutathione lyase